MIKEISERPINLNHMTQGFMVRLEKNLNPLVFGARNSGRNNDHYCAAVE